MKLWLYSAPRCTDVYKGRSLTSVTTPDGRFTVLMPHPERVFRNILMSWTSGDRSAASSWMQMFHDARDWAGR